MTQPDSQLNVSYPLANRSRGRRRRMLCLGNSAEVDPGPNPVASSATSTEKPAVVTLDQLQRPANLSGIDAIQHLVEGIQPATWVFTGDGISQGARHTAGARCFPELFAERVRWELRRLLDVVVNTGVVGGKCRNLLLDLDWRVTRFQPDVVFITLGLQDAVAGMRGLPGFRSELCELVDALEAAGAITVLNTPNIVLARTDDRLATLPEYVDQIRSVAEELDVPLIDHWSYWQQQCPDETSLRHWLGADGIHPNAYGHRQMARLLLHHLRLFERQSPTCVVPTPAQAPAE